MDIPRTTDRDPGRWRFLAACAGRTDVMFPDDDESDDTTRPAKRICAACPVRVDCLIAAMTGPAPFGVFAGTTPRTRMQLARDWVNRAADRPYPLRIDDPWSTTAALHFSGLDINFLGAVDPDDPAAPANLPGMPSRPTRAPAPAATAATCQRCGAPTRTGDVVDRNGPDALCGIAGTYSHGCRCDACADAHSERRRSERAAKKQAEAFPGQMSLTP